ncbi:MAG: serine/threonine-protein kinase [Polyangiales bacterium]
MRRAKRVGRYQLFNRIAYGGMAEIYRGVTYDAQGYRRDVAVKKLLPRYVEDRQFIEMLTDEFKLVSHLKHPSIAEVYELTEFEGELIIAMEYVDGKDLRSTLEQARRSPHELAIEDFIYILARALDGLQHAHVARDMEGKLLHIVHRDFSPSNILLSYDGHVKICDFGIAKATSSSIQTQTGIIKGKVKYMSPEQAYGRSLDWRSDIFSAGSVLYELVTGVAPFNAKTERDLIFAVRDAKAQPPDELNEDVGPELSRIILQALSRSRSARFQSCIDFRNALLAHLETRNPQYRRTDLARKLKAIWAPSIDAELRALEEYVLDDSRREDRDFGKNLIAEALGPDAPFSQFHPIPTETIASGEVVPVSEDAASDATDSEITTPDASTLRSDD